MSDDPATVARAIYQAYADKDRSAAEALIGDPFSFTSPLDNRIDRKTYFERCWPNSEGAAGFDLKHLVVDGEQVFATKGGKSFRNTEILTVRDGRIVDVEVYFGWDLPHRAPPGGFVDQP
jgi:ketosteroid isomerase-like protein